MPFFCISEPPTPGSALRLNADVLVVSDRMDPPTALSWMLLEPFDTSLETEMPVRTRSLRATRRVCGGRTRLTPEPGTFPPAVSCARAARSQQASSCTAGPRGQLGSPALGEIFFLKQGATGASVIVLPHRSLTNAISLVLLPISRSTWWSSRLSCSLDTSGVLAPPAGHLGCCWAAAAVWLWLAGAGCPARPPASLCSTREFVAACFREEVSQY